MEGAPMMALLYVAIGKIRAIGMLMIVKFDSEINTGLDSEKKKNEIYM